MASKENVEELAAAMEKSVTLGRIETTYNANSEEKYDAAMKRFLNAYHFNDKEVQKSKFIKGIVN